MSLRKSIMTLSNFISSYYKNINTPDSKKQKTALADAIRFKKLGNQSMDTIKKQIKSFLKLEDDVEITDQDVLNFLLNGSEVNWDNISKLEEEMLRTQVIQTRVPGGNGKYKSGLSILNGRNDDY